MNEKLEALYTQFKNAYGDKTPDYDKFVRGISDPNKREGIYKAFTAVYGDKMPDYQRFNRNIDSWIGSKPQPTLDQRVNLLEQADPDKLLNTALRTIEAPNTRQDITEKSITTAFQRGKEKEIIDRFKEPVKTQSEPSIDLAELDKSISKDFNDILKEEIAPKPIVADKTKTKKSSGKAYEEPSLKSEDIELIMAEKSLEEEGIEKPSIEEIQKRIQKNKNLSFSFTYNGLSDLFQNKLSPEQIDEFDKRLNERTFGQDAKDLLGMFGQGLTASGYDHAQSAVMSELEVLEEKSGIKLTEETKKEVSEMMAAEYEKHIDKAVAFVGEGLGYIAPGMATMKLTGSTIKTLLPSLVNPKTTSKMLYRNAVELIPLDLLDAYNRALRDKRRGDDDLALNFATYSVINVGLGGLFGTGIQKGVAGYKAIKQKIADSPSLKSKIQEYMSKIDPSYDQKRIAKELGEIIESADIEEAVIKSNAKKVDNNTTKIPEKTVKKSTLTDAQAKEEFNDIKLNKVTEKINKLEAQRESILKPKPGEPKLTPQEKSRLLKDTKRRLNDLYQGRNRILADNEVIKLESELKEIPNQKDLINKKDMPFKKKRHEIFMLNKRQKAIEKKLNDLETDKILGKNKDEFLDDGMELTLSGRQPKKKTNEIIYPSKDKIKQGQRISNKKVEESVVAKEETPIPITEISPKKIDGYFKRKMGYIKSKAIKYLTTKGHLPGETYTEVVKSDGKLNVHYRNIKYEARRFKEAIKKDYKKATKEDYIKIDKALKGQIKLSDLPENVARSVGRMRSQIDAMSRELIRRGIAQGDLKAIIKENQGTYVARSYEIHDAPEKWRKFITTTQEGQVIFNKAVNYIKSQNPGIKDIEAEGLVNHYLGKADLDDFAKSNSVTSNNKNLFKKRKLDDAPEIRALYGEYLDPLANYSRTMGRIAVAIEKDALIKNLRKTGLNKYFYEKQTGVYSTKVNLDHGPTNKKRQITSDNSPKDLYTTPEIAEALKNYKDVPIDGRVARFYIGANGLIKYGKTVGNIPITHVRNFISNPLFAISNGHWRLGKLGTSTKTVYSDLFGKKKFLGLVKTYDDNSLKKWNEKYKDYLSYGVVDESTYAGEIYKTLKEASKSEVGIEQVLDKKLGQSIKKGGEHLANFYRAQDDFWKIYAFENELARYKKVYPNKDVAEVKKIAAEIVRDTYPTYSKVPRGIRNLSRFPIFGQFVSWPSEVIRTQYKTIQIATREMAKKETVNIGRMRIAGVLSTPALGTLITSGANAMLNIDRQEDLDRRRFMAPWDRDGNIMYLGGNSYVNLSYTDAKSVIADPIRIIAGATSDEEISKRIKKGMFDLLEPFAIEEISTQALTAIKANQNPDTGGKIYLDNDELHVKYQKGAEYFWKKAKPGVFNFAERMYNKDGKYNVETELAANLLGIRRVEQNYELSMAFKISDFKKSLIDAKNVYRSTFYEKEKSRLGDAYEQSRKAILFNLREMKEDYDAAIRLGVDDQAIFDMLKGVDKVAKNFILYDDDEDFIDEYYIKGKAIIDKEFEEE